MSVLQTILDQAAAEQARLLTAAYDAGREAGRREANEEIWQKIGSLLPMPPTGLAMPAAPTASQTAGCAAQGLVMNMDGYGEGSRATPGSVKPEIARIVSERPGVSTRELHEATGFKLNSIRGTVWTLLKEGQIERRVDGLYPVAQKEEAAGTVSSEDAPTASEPERIGNALFD